MEQDAIREKVISAVRTVARLPYEEIPLDTPMEQLAADSIDQASLAFELEDALQIQVPWSEVLDGVKTLGDLVENMRRFCASAAGNCNCSEQKATA